MIQKFQLFNEGIASEDRKILSDFLVFDIKKKYDIFHIYSNISLNSITISLYSLVEKILMLIN